MSVHARHYREPALLRSATGPDAEALMSWFADRDACKLWGGPAFRHPFTPASFAEDMRFASLAGYALTDVNDTLLGFGQIYPKLQRIHLARLAIRPDMRGTGLGKRLIGEIITAGQKLFSLRDSSLFVYRRNAAARHCYSRMGFVDAAWPDRDRVLPDCQFMIRIEAVTAQDPEFI